MNIKFEKGGITLKISEDELGRLSQGIPLVMGVFPSSALSLQFSLAPKDHLRGMQIVMEGSNNHGNFVFFVSRKVIAELVRIGRNKEGFSLETDTGMILRLQVDVRRDSRHKIAA